MTSAPVDNCPDGLFRGLIQRLCQKWQARCDGKSSGACDQLDGLLTCTIPK